MLLWFGGMYWDFGPKDPKPLSPKEKVLSSIGSSIVGLFIATGAFVVDAIVLGHILTLGNGVCLELAKKGIDAPDLQKYMNECQSLTFLFFMLTLATALLLFVAIGEVFEIRSDFLKYIEE